jgi:predicted amidohydrolase YtcJ
MGEAGLRDRPDDDDLFGQPRRHAHARSRMARELHAAVLWDFYQPNREAHGSYWFHWTTEDEVAWKNFYRVWMAFLNDYKNAGGRVATGSDSGFIYQTYGFGYILELELLQEAGFHPLEVIRAATLNGAEALHEPKGRPIEFGIIRPGLLADLVIVDQNPDREPEGALRHGRG